MRKQPHPLFNLLTASLVLAACHLSAHNTPEHERKIEFPNILGYETLIADLHQHTAFSDGHVWPTVRVWEAEADGVDVIATTDHLEHRPHQDDLPFEDANRAYQIAKEEADKRGNVIVLNGGEVSRDMPPGHVNAVFMKDVNELFVDDPMEAFRRAHEQGAYIFWNHPQWIAHRPDGMAQLTDMHRELIKRGHINGIEVVNKTSYSDEALQIALDNDLTIMGNSDIHGLVDYDFQISEGGHRPVTLVFATDKSEAAVKEALFAGRTAVCFNDTLVGHAEYLQPLIAASVTVKDARILASYTGESLVVGVTLANQSSIDFIFENRSDYTLHNQSDVFMIPARGTIEVQVKVLEKVAEFQLPLAVLNAVVAPKTHPIIGYAFRSPAWTEEEE